MLFSLLLCNLTAEGNYENIKEILSNVKDLAYYKDYDLRTPLHIAAVKDKAKIA